MMLNGRFGSEDSLDSAFSSPSFADREDQPASRSTGISVRRNLEAEFDVQRVKKRIVEVLPIAPLHGNRKCVRDNIHQTIEAHELCMRIACTPQVRRLRNLKQLGTASLVYPSAIFSRYNHSLGVMHLARRFLKRLQEIYGDDIVDEKDILCAEIAGLLHDVGHGSFSHMFETFLARVNATGVAKHEKMSIILIDEIFELEEIRPLLLKYDITDRDKMCIKEMVYGVLEGEEDYRGRDHDKHFIMRLVNNTLNGLDVDKLDYLLRDAVSIGEPCPDFLSRLLDNIRVVRTDDGRTELAFMHKVVFDLEAVARMRMSLHTKLYQHQKVKIFDEMFIDMMVAADPFLQFPTRSGGVVRLSEVTLDTLAFLATDDEEIQRRIDLSTDPGMRAAQEILYRINWRQCYTVLGSIRLGPGEEDLASLKKSFKDFIADRHIEDLDLGLLEISITSGFKGNSLDNFLFIDKEDKEVTTSRSVTFPVERTLVCFSRAEDPLAYTAGREYFHRFAADHLM